MSVLIMSEVFVYSDTRLATRLVLLALADAANDSHRMCWESAETIAGKARVSKRQAYVSLAALEKDGIVEHVPDDEAPLESLRYKSVVRRIKPVAEWPVASDSADSASPSSADSAHPVSKFSPNPNNQLQVEVIEETTSLPPRQSARYEPEEAKEVSMRPGGKGWDAVRPVRTGGRKKTRKQIAEEAAQAERELDPAYVVAQSLGEDAPENGQDGPLPASEDLPAPTSQRSRKPRSLRPSEVLASFFDKRAQAVGHPVPGATNFGALSANFGRWMTQGTDKDEIRQMIITYWSSSWQRSENVVAWKDFLAQRGLLTGRAAKVEKVNEMEKHRYDEDYWS
ncbi:helix-turn-helix domain-containing protein [Streptomyces sp. NPDC058252]|uniref:helix-turn-helix domain-containing protein n=1 Tax=Streptomyces sp. NPDC058252 TaxID=3346405 RepID=UPI0036E382F6